MNNVVVVVNVDVDVVIVIVNVVVVIVACELKMRRMLLDCIKVATIIGEKIRMRWRKKNIIFWERISELKL